MRAANDLDDPLERAVVSAEAAWPDWRIERRAFKDRLRVLVDGAEDRPRALSELHLADLYLAHGCVLGIDGAVRAFVSAYLSKIGSYLQDLPVGSVVHDDVRVRVEDLLLLARDDGGPRVSQYKGVGPLEAYVARVSKNVAISLMRRPDHARDRDTDMILPLAGNPTPNGLQPVNARDETLIRDAIRSALGTLDRRQRAIVRLHLSKGISFTHIARMLNVHQTTVSRAFESAMRKLHGEARRRLRSQGLNDAEMASIARGISGQIDLSLSRLLHESSGEL